MYLVEADRQRDADGNKTGTRITVLMDRGTLHLAVGSEVLVEFDAVAELDP